MVLVYADFGPDGTVVSTMNMHRKVGQYVVFSVASYDSDTAFGLPTGVPLQALYRAWSIAIHDLDTDTVSWYKNRHKQVDNEPLNKSERDVLLIQLLASEAW